MIHEVISFVEYLEKESPENFPGRNSGMVRLE